MIIFYMCNVAEGAMILEMIDRIISFFGISTALMGVKSVTSSFGKNHRLQLDSCDEPKKKQRRQEDNYCDDMP